MKIEEALKWIDNAIDYWAEESDYDEKEEDVKKTDEAYKTIGEVAKGLGLIDKKTGNIQTHTLRYWETQFKQIRPSIKAGNRRYYSKKDFTLIKTDQSLNTR